MGHLLGKAVLYSLGCTAVGGRGGGSSQHFPVFLLDVHWMWQPLVTYFLRVMESCFFFSFSFVWGRSATGKGHSIFFTRTFSNRKRTAVLLLE